VKVLKLFVQFALGVIAITLPLALIVTAVDPDYRIIPRFVSAALVLLASPFQLLFASLHIVSLHDVGIPAMTLGVAGVELLIIWCFRRLRARRTPIRN